MEVQIDTKKNLPTVLKDEEIDWYPVFYPYEGNKALKPVSYKSGTSVEIEMEASYIRGRLSVDEYLKQCAIVNPHLQLHYRITLLKNVPKENDTENTKNNADSTFTSEKEVAAEVPDGWITFIRATNKLPDPAMEIKPHPHGVELGMLMQMLKDSESRTLRTALATDFSRISDKTALEICEKAGINPKANPAKIAQRDIEVIYKAINETKLMRPPVDCLSPIGEEQILAGMKKEIQADFYTAVTRPPAVYRGNPFQIEAGLAYAKSGENENVEMQEPIRLMRFANKVPLLYMAGACAMTKAVISVNWKNYGLSHPRGSLPIGPMVLMIHMASVWVPFTSESKEAIAHYPEIIREITFCLQECGRRLSVFLSKRRRQMEAERKRNYMSLYIPHLAFGLKDILNLSSKEEANIIKKLHKMLERTHLQE